MELPFLVSNGCLKQNISRGVLKECPFSLQLAITTGFTSHVHTVLSPFLAAISSDQSHTSEDLPFAEKFSSRLPIPFLRSEEDLVYLTNTVGIAFSFPCGEREQPNCSDVISKALDVYSVILSTKFHDTALAHLPASVLSQHVVFMLEHLTALFKARADVPSHPSLSRHADLVGKCVGVVSLALRGMARRLAEAQWTHVLCLLSSSMLYYAAATEKDADGCFFPKGAVQLSLASLHWEAVLLSNARDTVAWDALVKSRPVSAEAVTQWGAAMVALTRTMARVSVTGGRGSDTAADIGRSSGSIIVRWVGVQQGVRGESEFIDMAQDFISFVWKRLLELMYQQEDVYSVMPLAAQIIFVGALRDMSLLLANSSYLLHCPPELCYCFGKAHALIGAASPLVPLGPSSASICTLFGDALVKCFAPPKVSTASTLTGESLEDWDALTIRALQGLSYALLRRETAVAVNQPEGSGGVPRHLQLLFSAISVLGEHKSSAVRCEIVLQTSPLFFLDLPIPLLTAESIGNAACALSAGLFDQEEDTLVDDDEDDEVDVSRSTVKKIWGVVSALNTYMYAKVSGMPSPLPNAVFAAFYAALETQQKIVPIMQRLVCASSVLFFHVGGSVNPKLADILQSLLNIVTSPYGTCPQGTLLATLQCLGWIPLDQYPLHVAKHVVAVLSGCCVSARAVMEQADLGIEDTTIVYVSAARSMCNIISHAGLGFALCRDDAVAAAVLQAVEAGTRDALVPSTGMRDAASSLYHAYLYALTSPFADGSTASSSAETEADYLSTATAVACFSVGSFRLMTLIQHQPQRSEEGEGGVAIIIRSPSGRRVFHATHRAFEALSALGETAVFEEAVRVAGARCDGPAAPPSQPTPPATNPLCDVWSEPSVKAVLKELATCSKCNDAVAAMSAVRFAPRDAYSSYTATYSTTNPTMNGSSVAIPVSSDRIISDLANDNTEAARQVASAVLQLGKGPVRSIPFDTSLIAVLKGIDALPEKEVLDVALVCVVDDGHHDASSLHGPSNFWWFAHSLGRAADGSREGPTREIIYEDGHRRIHFFPTISPASRVGSGPQMEAPDGGSGSPAYSSVRLLWDATGDGYDWPSIDHAAHDAFRELSPNFRPSYHRQCFDILLRPLPHVGLTSVRLQLPEPLSSINEAPLSWGAPLLHGGVLPSTVLPRMVVESIHNSVTQRLMEVNAYRFPSLLRKAAIWGIVGRQPLLLPLQYISSLAE